ncbi:hypothetical protein GCM10020001_061150 [Nonomuraea salmonea]
MAERVVVRAGLRGAGVRLVRVRLLVGVHELLGARVHGRVGLLVGGLGELVARVAGERLPALLLVEGALSLVRDVGRGVARGVRLVVRLRRVRALLGLRSVRALVPPWGAYGFWPAWP